MFKKDFPKEERRQYIRLDSAFPVAFRIFSLDDKTALSDWLQGFTSNIGKGGICLSVNNLKTELANALKEKQAKLSLSIEMPLGSDPVSASCQVKWVQGISTQPGKYIIGLGYDKIAAADNNRIVRYALAKRLFVPAALSVIIILGLGIAMSGYINVKLIKGNKVLVEQLVKILQESSVAKQAIKAINKEKEDLQLRIQESKLRIKTIQEEKERFLEKLKLEAKAQFEETIAARKLNELNDLIEKSIQEKNALLEQLIAAQYKENSVTEELLRLDRKKVGLEKANLDRMYQWLKVRQNPNTGLVMSFEGDRGIANQAFIYDQSLVMLAYSNFSDFERARKILDFFNKKAQKKEGLFLNAYYVNDGNPVESIVYSDPNIWVGIAILRYTQKTQDFNYLGIAEEIASRIINSENPDSGAGIRGGPDADWCSTEHNLNAYAFFNMLYKVTDKKEYLLARDKVFHWLTQYVYSRLDIAVKRGKEDSVIARDTYAYSIAAVGPEKLEELGMNPDMLVEFSEKNCSVEASYARPEGQIIKIKGFDFSADRGVADKGVVSSEWTAQMVIAFKIMADFYYKKEMIAKARAYELKADEYLTELGRMIISSPSLSGQGESCLPYATADVVDTGHDWMTPKGKSRGSLAGTAWTLFAYYNYNPLEIK